MIKFALEAPATLDAFSAVIQAILRHAQLTKEDVSETAWCDLAKSFSTAFAATNSTITPTQLETLQADLAAQHSLSLQNDFGIDSPLAAIASVINFAISHKQRETAR